VCRRLRLGRLRPIRPAHLGARRLRVRCRGQLDHRHHPGRRASSATPSISRPCSSVL
jgi:hypothetical protein